LVIELIGYVIHSIYHAIAVCVTTQAGFDKSNIRHGWTLIVYTQMHVLFVFIGCHDSCTKERTRSSSKGFIDVCLTSSEQYKLYRNKGRDGLNDFWPTMLLLFF